MTDTEKKLTLEQRLTASKIFALTDPKRFFVACYLLDDEPMCGLELRQKFLAEYGEVAENFRPFSDFTRHISSICSNSLSTLGAAEESIKEVEMPVRGVEAVRAWRSTPLVEELSDYLFFIQQVAVTRIGLSTYALFSHLSGNTPYAPLNKAMILSSMAAVTQNTPGKKVGIWELEGSVGIAPDNMSDHLEKFAELGLVVLEPFSEQSISNMHFYRWASQLPPPQNLPVKLQMIANHIFAAYRRDETAVVGTNEFSPSLFKRQTSAANELEKLVKRGLIEPVTRHHFRHFRPTELGIEVATELVDPVIAAVRGEAYARELVLQGATAFKAQESQNLLLMAQQYVAASKTI